MEINLKQHTLFHHRQHGFRVMLITGFRMGQDDLRTRLQRDKSNRSLQNRLLNVPGDQGPPQPKHKGRDSLRRRRQLLRLSHDAGPIGRGLRGPPRREWNVDHVHGRSVSVERTLEQCGA